MVTSFKNINWIILFTSSDLLPHVTQRKLPIQLDMWIDPSQFQPCYIRIATYMHNYSYSFT